MTGFDGSLSELYDSPRERCELCGEYGCDCNEGGDMAECPRCGSDDPRRFVYELLSTGRYSGCRFDDEDPWVVPHDKFHDQVHGDLCECETCSKKEREA